MIKSLMMTETQNIFDQSPHDHLPVMPDEVLDFMDPKSNEVFVDGTLGMGGACVKIFTTDWFQRLVNWVG